MSLVFYDTETTGTQPFFDQVLQFAGIHTDAELRELDRFEKRCRLLPHVVPSPGALRITRVTVARLLDPKLLSHYEMARAIRAKLLTWSPALFLGWNSIRFDEEMMRQAFYKTLHNPYLTNTNGNCRSDVMRMAQACTLYAPDAIQFARDDSGKLIFRLEEVADANGFSAGSAHEAMRDAEATLFVSRLIMANAPRVWSAFMRFSKKATVVDFIGEEAAFCLHNFYSGRLLSCFSTKLGQNSTNTSEWYAYDLACDPNLLISSSDEELHLRLETHPKPVRVLKSNAAPILFPIDEALNVGLTPAGGLSEMERRSKFVQDDSGFRERLISVFESQRVQYEKSPHVEMQIYDGFADTADEQLMEQFHAAEWAKRHAIVERFQDGRLRTIGQRLIHNEKPGLLHETLCQKHSVAIARRLLGHDGDDLWMTLPKALSELSVVLADSPEHEHDFFREHERHLRRVHSEMQNVHNTNPAAGGNV